jgi:acyl carrier protein
MQEIFEKLENIIAEELEVDVSDIDIDQDFYNELDIDSLDLIDIVCAVEIEFDISISDSEVMEIETPRDLVNLIIQKRGE